MLSCLLVYKLNPINLFCVFLSLLVGGGVSAVREGGGGAPGVRQSGPAADRRPMPRHFGTSRQRSGGQLLTHRCTQTHTHWEKHTWIKLQSQKASKHLTVSHKHRNMSTNQLHSSHFHRRNKGDLKKKNTKKYCSRFEKTAERHIVHFAVQSALLACKLIGSIWCLSIRLTRIFLTARKQKEPSPHSPSVTLSSGHLVSFQAVRQLDLQSWLDVFYGGEKIFSNCIKRLRVSWGCQVVSEAQAYTLLPHCYLIGSDTNVCVYFSCLWFFTSFAAIFLTFSFFFLFFFVSFYLTKRPSLRSLSAVISSRVV